MQVLTTIRLLKRKVTKNVSQSGNYKFWNILLNTRGMNTVYVQPSFTFIPVLIISNTVYEYFKGFSLYFSNINEN